MGYQTCGEVIRYQGGQKPWVCRLPKRHKGQHV
jgi:hypothetical protein